MIDVMVVDDSALVRQGLKEVLDTLPDMKVSVLAPDPIVAAERLRIKVPDVIILDVEMPRMDGLTFLRKIMTQHPLPVIICSSLAERGSETALKALEYGAVEVIFKPRIGVRDFFEESRILIGDAVRAAAAAKLSRMKRPPGVGTMEVSPKLTADAVLPAASSRAMVQTTEKVVVVGASTGGTEALRVFLEQMPVQCPGIVVVQHMPEHFTRSFAERLNSLCRITVKEAQNNDSVLPGHALIAPGNHHTLIKRSGARYFVEVREGPLVSRHRPSVDVLFRSAARYAGKNAIGVILTGMGDDGAKGMKEMAEAGSFNFAQDEASCVVFGMPREAIELGGAHQVLSLESIPAAVLRKAHSGS